MLEGADPQGDLLPGNPIAASQSEPQVLCIDGLRHVASHYVLAHLPLSFLKEQYSTIAPMTVGKCFEKLKKQNQRTNPRRIGE